jgi:hypothetical protein
MSIKRRKQAWCAPPRTGGWAGRILSSDPLLRETGFLGWTSGLRGGFDLEFEEVAETLDRHQTDATGGELPVPEDENGRNALDAIPRGDGRVIVDVQLPDHDVRPLLRQRFDAGGEGAQKSTTATPFAARASVSKFSAVRVTIFEDMFLPGIKGPAAGGGGH